MANPENLHGGKGGGGTKRWVKKGDISQRPTGPHRIKI